MNKYPHNSHTPYKLVIDGVEFGCYADDMTAKGIARSKLMNRECKSYSVYDLNDNKIDGE